MLTLTLRRVAATAQGTFGVLIGAGGPFCVTLEREYDGGSNRPSTPEKAGACIPAGTYDCQPVVSPKFGQTHEVTNVPKRSHILFHAGNLDDDSRGCIILGESYAVFGNDGAGIAQSRDALREFEGWVRDIPFRLVIENRF